MPVASQTNEVKNK